MGSTQQFCLKWNNHQSNMLSIFDQLLTSEHFVDVTLACDGLSVRAHKMVLSACSPFFQSLFIQNPCEHPIVILKDIRFVDLKALVQFMYRGEVNVSQDQLPTLLKAAETLKIKGLAEVTNETGQKSTVGGSLGVSHNGHHSSSGGVTKTEQPSVQAAPSTLSSTPAAIPSNATTHSLVAAMQQNALKAQLAAAAQVAQAAAAAAAVQNAHESRQSVVSAASHESNSNASTPLRQTDSPMSQQMRKRRRKSAGSDKGSGDENSGPESGAEDNLEETRASDDESAGEEAEFEPSKLLEQSMTEVRQGHQDNNSSSSDNHTKDSNQADMKPVINFDTATGGNALALNPTDPSAVLAFAAAAQAAQAAGAAAASATPGDSVAGPSQPTHAPMLQIKAEGHEIRPDVECVVCAATLSSQWAVDEGGNTLCKMCAQCANTRSESDWNSREKRNGGSTGMICHNCNTTTTTLWRRNNEGFPVCNACGLYYKLHNTNRPLALKKKDIQTRRRKSGGGQLKKKDLPPPSGINIGGNPGDRVPPILNPSLLTASMGAAWQMIGQNMALQTSLQNLNQNLQIRPISSPQPSQQRQLMVQVAGNQTPQHSRSQSPSDRLVIAMPTNSQSALSISQSSNEDL